MRGIVVFCLVILLTYPCFSQQDQRENFLKKISQEAITAYEKNDLEAAVFKLNQILLAKPSDKEALYLREAIGDQMLIQMLMKGGEISRVARTLLLYAEKPLIIRKTDQNEIQKLVESIVSGKLFQRHQAIAELETQVGELAIPSLLPYLSNRTQDNERINAVLAIHKLGHVAVVPLIEALQSYDYFLRTQIVIQLGHLGSKLALPDLKRIIEDPNESADIKSYAQNSIKQITGKPSVAFPAAKVLYYQKALGYYNNEYEYHPASALHWLQWKWQKNRLVYQEIPPFLYNEIMAENACYRALEIDPSYQKAWALLARVYYAQYTEVKSVEDAVKERSLQLPKEDVQKFLQEQPFAMKAGNVAVASSPDILYLALKDSLSVQEKRPEVTVKILEDIGDSCRGRGDIPSVLINALLNKDKRVRYAAAEAIAKISPMQQFSDAPQVIKVLEEAMGEWDARAILLIENDDAIRNKIDDIIRNRPLNMQPFSCNNGLEGLRRAKSFPPEDMIIISTELQDISTVDIVNAIQNDYQNKDTPILLVCPENKKDSIRKLYKNIKQVKGILTTPIVPAQVQSEIKKNMDLTRSEYKAKADQVAQRAVEALASIHPNTMLFKFLGNSSDALVDVLLKRNDSIRIPAIVALGNLSEKKAVENLHELLLDKDTDIMVRFKAAWALGKIYHKNKIKIDGNMVEKIASILEEKPSKDLENNVAYKLHLQALQRQVYVLLGQANLSAETRRELFQVHRIHKDIPIVEAKPEKAKPTTTAEEEENIHEPANVEENPSEENTTPSEETPSEETPSEENPSEETPSEENTTPSEENPSEENPSEENTTPSEENTTPSETENWGDEKWQEGESSNSEDGENNSKWGEE